MCSENDSILGYRWIDITNDDASMATNFEDDHYFNFFFEYYGILYDNIIPTNKEFIHFDSSYYERLGVHPDRFSQCGLPTSSTY